MVVTEVDEDGNEADFDLDNGVDFIIQPWADAERIGNAIANSKNLLKLDIQEFWEPSQVVAAPWLFDVFRGLTRNRSIEHLEIYDVQHTAWSPFEIINPFFENNRNLRCIQLHSIDLSVHFESFLIALSLCDDNQLERISLNGNNLGGKRVTKFINALQDHRNLLELEIVDNSMSRIGFLALSKLLQHPKSKIHCLKVGDSFTSQHSFGDEYITILTGALVVNKTIKILAFDGHNVTANGWRVFSCILFSPICSLERLTLHGVRLDDEGITFIGDSLVKNKVLNYLNLSYNSQITPVGWQGFSICLRSSTCALQELDLSSCGAVNGIAGGLATNTSVKTMNISYCRINDAGAIEIADSLAVNSSLKVLKIDHNDSVTAAGWVGFFNRLTDSACSLEELHIHSSRIDDEGAAALVDLLDSLITLKCLKLTHCNMITTNGWRAIARVPQRSSVTTLDLGGDNINDDTVISCAMALASNKCLRNLTLHGREITDRIWRAFTNILCDNSSPQSTYYCNHTLQRIRIENNWNPMQVPKKIARVLKLNAKHEDKKSLVRQKIIANHFSEIDTRAFSVMSAPVLTQALEWIGRDILGFSLMYQVSRAVLVPKLFE